jgi:heat shock protein HtpX
VNSFDKDRIMKRIMLLIGTNLAIMLVLGIVSSLTGAHRFFSDGGLDLGKPAVLCLADGLRRRLHLAVDVEDHRQVEYGRAGHRDAGQFDGALAGRHGAPLCRPRPACRCPKWRSTTASRTPSPPAPGRNSSLVAVSTGLLQSMTRGEAEAVIAHEVAHIANGDMVTLTLIQGVVNTFVIFIARVVGWLVDSALRRGQRRKLGAGNRLHGDRGRLRHRLRHPGKHHRHVLLAAARIPCRCRRRPADRLATADDGALRRLGGLEAGDLPQNLATAGINGRPGWMELFSSHPPIEQRIAALQSRA